MNDEDKDLIVGALDSLGLALAKHEHRWTDGERAIYEEALKTLFDMAERANLSGEAAASGNAPTPYQGASAPSQGAFTASSDGDYQRIAREAAERIALNEPMILARRATIIFEALEQALLRFIKQKHE